MRSKIDHDTGVDEVVGGFTFVMSLLRRHQLRRVKSGCSLLVFEGSVLGHSLRGRLFNMRRVYSVLLCCAFIGRFFLEIQSSPPTTSPLVFRFSHSSAKHHHLQPTCAPQSLPCLSLPCSPSCLVSHIISRIHLARIETFSHNRNIGCTTPSPCWPEFSEVPWVADLEYS